MLSKKEKLTSKAELSKEDLKILEFLVNAATIKFEDFLEMVGPFYNILKIAEELNKKDLKSEYLAMFILTPQRAMACRLVGQRKEIEEFY
ncbi:MULTISPECIES: hypothetical protein [unclassified Archaeoglobus]|uniref:hypothetical protein n=1 Tax=unclassified Archaeoglobus TaxID=2643606 RepID=UPI0025BCDC1D|nr:MULTISPECIES: hypothetical protein [unclassified Archaeoglobus]